MYLYESICWAYVPYLREKTKQIFENLICKYCRTSFRWQRCKSKNEMNEISIKLFSRKQMLSFLYYLFLKL